MSYNIANSGSFLRTSRTFPADPQPLSVELNKSYIEIAQTVNQRTIGIFAIVQTITGNSWFIGNVSPNANNQRQQTLRQVFTFTAAGSIPHNINVATIGGFVPGYGSFTDNSDPTIANWYGCIYGSNVAIAGQVSFYITPTNIVILAGAGAPAIVRGFVVLEWLSQV